MDLRPFGCMMMTWPSIKAFTIHVYGHMGEIDFLLLNNKLNAYYCSISEKYKLRYNIFIPLIYHVSVSYWPGIVYKGEVYNYHCIFWKYWYGQYTFFSFFKWYDLWPHSSTSLRTRRGRRNDTAVYKPTTAANRQIPHHHSQFSSFVAVSECIASVCLLFSLDCCKERKTIIPPPPPQSSPFVVLVNSSGYNTNLNSSRLLLLSFIVVSLFYQKYILSPVHSVQMLSLPNMTARRPEGQEFKP